MKNSILTRILSLALAAVMVTGVMTACGSNPGGDQSTADSASPDEAVITDTSVALCANVDYISVPDEDAEIAQELTLTLDGAELSGSLTENDVTLKDAFEGMKVSKLSNDQNSITLTVSGSPVIADDSAINDNFTTTSLIEKQLYSLDIEVHLKKALGLLCFFKGFDANDANLKLADSVYYPDFESVTTDKNGNPYCYLSGSYVYMTGELSSFLYNPMKNNRLSNYVFLGKADAERFSARMHGRTLKEEMIFAGFSEEKMNEATKLDPLVNPNKSGTENRKVGGLGFYYEKWNADKFNKTDAYYRIPNTLAAKAGYPSANNFQTVPSYSKDGGAFAVVSLPMLWDDTKLNGGLGTEGVFLSKHDWEAGGQGWYVCYPTLTLAKAS